MSSSPYHPGSEIVLKDRPRTGRGQLLREIEPGRWRIQFAGHKGEATIYDFMPAETAERGAGDD